MSTFLHWYAAAAGVGIFVFFVSKSNIHTNVSSFTFWWWYLVDKCNVDTVYNFNARFSAHTHTYAQERLCSYGFSSFQQFSIIVTKNNCIFVIKWVRFMMSPLFCDGSISCRWLKKKANKELKYKKNTPKLINRYSCLKSSELLKNALDIRYLYIQWSDSMCHTFLPTLLS